jgi:hypothetical protein
VTGRAIAGLVVLQLGFLAAGLSLFWAMRGFRTWADVLRLAGLAYLLGVAAFGIAWTELLVVGVPFGGVGVVTSLAAIALAGLAIAGARRNAVPRGWPRPARPAAVVVGAAGVALTGLLLESLFRAARLQSLQSYDGWAFWVTKGKAIYLFGGLDEQVFTSVPGPTYPPVVPILDATSFHAMGSADQVTLHLQYWFLVLGGLAAIAGCLHRHAPPWLVWPPLLLVAAVPRFGTRLLEPQADMLVDVLFVVATLLLALWVRDGRGWRLAAAATLLGGAALTKREGVFFAACALGVALLAGVARGRWRPLLLSGAVVVAVALPWRIWYRSVGIGGEAPPAAGLEGSAERALDALRLSLGVLFDLSLWSIVPVVVLVALAASLALGDRFLGGFATVLLVLLFLGGAWVTFSYPDLPVTANEALNPIVRYTGAIVLLGASLLPLLLASVLNRPATEAAR